MKKNSIEETKRIIEKLISAMKSDRELFTEKTDKEIYTFFINALEFILSDYNRVLKENEKLKKQVQRQINTWNKDIKLNYISKHKIKDKIEELKSNPLKIKQNDKYYYETHAYNKIIISVLQELIEERDEK